MSLSHFLKRSTINPYHIFSCVSILKYDLREKSRFTCTIKFFSGDKFRMVLAKTLREDGTPDDGEYNPTDTGPSRADSFEYVMHGKVYRIEGDDTGPDSSRL